MSAILSNIITRDIVFAFCYYFLTILQWYQFLIREQMLSIMTVVDIWKEWGWFVVLALRTFAVFMCIPHMKRASDRLPDPIQFIISPCPACELWGIWCFTVQENRGNRICPRWSRRTKTLGSITMNQENTTVMGGEAVCLLLLAAIVPCWCLGWYWCRLLMCFTHIWNTDCKGISLGIFH